MPLRAYFAMARCDYKSFWGDEHPRGGMIFWQTRYTSFSLFCISEWKKIHASSSDSALAILFNHCFLKHPQSLKPIATPLKINVLFGIKSLIFRGKLAVSQSELPHLPRLGSAALHCLHRLYRLHLTHFPHRSRKPRLLGNVFALISTCWLIPASGIKKKRQADSWWKAILRSKPSMFLKSLFLFIEPKNWSLKTLRWT